MPVRLSHNCKVNIVPGRYFLWHHISDIPAQLVRELPFDIKELGGLRHEGTYIRKAYDHEAYHVAGGQKGDDYCLVSVFLPEDVVDDCILVPRALLERI